MQENLQFVYDLCEEQMQKAFQHFNNELLKIRAGRANPNVLDGIKIDYYGAETPLTQVSNVMVQDARTLTIQPWEKSILEDIERVIVNANIGLSPQNNGEKILINIPPLTEERRRDLVKQIHAEAETSRISIRSSRHKANEEIKKLQKEGLSEDLARDGEIEVQELTNNFVEKIESLQKDKEKEIMTI